MPLLDGEIADVAVAAADLDRLVGDLDGHLAGLQLGHRALRLLELAAAAAFPERPPDQGPSGLDVGRHVGEHESDRLVLDQRAAELLAFLRVLQGELERGPRDAQGHGADDRAGQLEGLERHRRPGMGAFARLRQLRLELLDAAEHVLGRDGHVLEDHLGRVRGPDAHLLFLFALPQALGARPHHEAGLAPGAELRLDGSHHHVNVGDAAVGDEDLLAVDHPVAVLADGAGLHRRHVGAGLGLGDGKRAESGLLRGSETGRDPGRNLLGGALREDRRHRQTGALDGKPDPGAPPRQLLGNQGRHDAGGVAVGLLEKVDPIKTYLGSLLDHGPGKLLGLVVLRGHGTDLFLGERVHPITNLTLLVRQLERNHFLLALLLG